MTTARSTMDQGMRIAIVATIEALIAPFLPAWWLPVHLWGTAVTAAVGVAVLLRYTPLLGKRASGEIPLWSWLLWWPWHAAVHASAWWYRDRGAPSQTEVVPGWWLGAWPRRTDGRWQAVLDLTCELPRRVDTEHYLCLPTWDMTEPSPEALEAAVAFMLAHRRAGHDVLVHCAHGRGRSTTALVAGLVASGVHPTWQEALDDVRARRPTVRLSTEQRLSLTTWQARLLPAVAER